MRRILIVLGLPVLALVLAGCGGDSGGEKNKNNAANNPPAPIGGAGGGPAAAAPAGGAAPGGGGGPPGGMGGMADMARAMAMGRGGAGAGAEQSGSGGGGATSTPLAELMKYIPENLKQATGLHVGAVRGDKKNPAAGQLMLEFQPVIQVLNRAGIKTDQIEYIWAGCNRETNDMIICARGKSGFDANAATKGLGASDAEKVGKSRMHVITSGKEKNAVALVDSKTILAGRYETVKKALAGPKRGPVRMGLEAMDQYGAFYWIGGDAEQARKRLAGSEIQVFQEYASEGQRMQGYALGFGGGSTTPAATGGGGMPGFGGGPPGGMPGPPGGFPGAGAGGPPGGMPGMPGMPGGGGSQKPDERRLDGALGMSFVSEGLATTAENRLNELIRKYAPRSNQGGMPGMPGGMPGPGRGGPPSADVNSDEGLRALLIDDDGWLKQAPPGGRPGGAPAGPPGGVPGGPPGGIPGPPGGAPGGPPGGMPGPPGGMPGMPGMPGAQQNDERNIRVTVARKETNIRVGLSIPNRPEDGVVFVAKAFNDAIQAAGGVAISDGLFEGALPTLGKGLEAAAAAKTGTTIKGLKRFGDDMPVWYGYSWMVELLPYVGFNDLYLQFDQSKTWAEPGNKVFTFQVVPAFVNPADPYIQWDGFPYDGMGLTHFAGMAGIEDRRNVVAAELPRSDPRAGIFGYDEIAKLSDVTDGAAQTIMMIGTGKSAAPWVQGGGGTIRGARQPYFDPFTGFGSKGLTKHGTYVLFADGSSRVISADIDPEVFKAMCTMHGAEQVDMQKLLTSDP